jgi:hypothetical protein
VPSFRIDITADIVRQAAAMARASEDSTVITDWFDIRQHYLQLRQRGRQATWYVRARGRSKRIGVANSIRGEYDREYLSIKQARDRAAEVYGGIEAPPPKPASSEPEVTSAWTWSDCDREYQASLLETRWIGGAGGREKPPSRGTQDDVRLAFAKPALQALHPKSLTDLQPIEIVRAIETIHAANGHRVACKALAYVKSALTWATNKRGAASGLYGATAWWQAIQPPDPSATEIGQIRERRSTLAQAKVGFTVDHLGSLLVQHEAYCAAERVSPGVRWGLWWVAYTANRRQSTVALERKRLMQTDEFGREGWGRAAWPIEDMKGRSEFWLPLPPAVLAVANGSISDWHHTIRRSHGEITTRWVFSSTRRHGRDWDNDDVAVYRMTRTRRCVISSARGQQQCAYSARRDSICKAFSCAMDASIRARKAGPVPTDDGSPVSGLIILPSKSCCRTTFTPSRTPRHGWSAWPRRSRIFSPLGRCVPLLRLCRPCVVLA